MQSPTMVSRPTSQVTTVVFDLGQVLVGWDPYLAFAPAWSRHDYEAFVTEIDFPAFNHEQDAGRLIADARDALGRTHPHRVAHFDQYIARFADTLTGPVPGTAEIVDELRDAGVRVLGLTNWSAETFHEAARSAPVIDRLESILVSGEAGLAKPDPAIYRLLLERYGLEAARTVFIDDTTVNVDAAAETGIVALHFTGAAGLRADLTALGLPLAG